MHFIVLNTIRGYTRNVYDVIIDISRLRSNLLYVNYSFACTSILLGTRIYGRIYIFVAVVAFETHSILFRVLKENINLIS